MPASRPANDSPVNAPPLPLPREHWNAIHRVLKLSPMQTKVVELVLRGLCDKQIADALGIGEATVRTYLERIAARTKTRGRMELALRVLAVSHEVNLSSSGVHTSEDT